MRSISEVSKLSGVSVRTLHHYDAVGLLSPTVRTGAGYRLYDDEAIARLQVILLFRELEFPLKDIREIMENPGFDVKKALSDQISLLTLRKKHLEGLISLAETIIKEGVNPMGFSAFRKNELESYEAEVREKWGNTQAYAEAKKKNASPEAADGMMKLFSGLGELKDLPPESAEVQNRVAVLQAYITENFYTCTKEILASLGSMYTEDERFRHTIDAAGGEGTAVFVRKAIEIFCK